MPSPGPPPEADLLVAGSLKPREIKRLLQKRHGYTPQAVAKLMLKDELVEALVAEENAAWARAGARAYAEEGGALGLFSLDRWERWYAGNTPLAVALLVALLTAVLFATPLYQTLNFQLSLWYDRRQHQCSRAYRAGSVVGVAGIFLLAALDAVKVWMRVTIGLGWVTPRRYYWRIVSAGRASGGSAKKVLLHAVPRLARAKQVLLHAVPRLAFAKKVLFCGGSGLRRSGVVGGRPPEPPLRPARSLVSSCSAARGLVLGRSCTRARPLLCSCSAARVLVLLLGRSCARARPHWC
jgi:hypothetical protein